MPGTPVAGEDGAAGGREMIGSEVFAPAAELLAIIFLCGGLFVTHLSIDLPYDLGEMTRTRTDKNG
jgi:hypothetical protein